MSELPTLGFIGAGEITTALVTGFCGRMGAPAYPIIVSPRGAENAAKLVSAFPRRVTAAKTNQEVVDRSDVVVLAMLPEQGEEICRQLRFRAEQGVVNLMCDRALSEIRSWIGDTAALVHMVPSTFNAFFDGPIILCPYQREIADIFGAIGVIVPVEERRQAGVLASITACMLSFFTLQDQLVQWAAAKGVPGRLAAQFTEKFFQALSAQAARASEDQLHTLATVTTPGGVNYRVKNEIESMDGFQSWVRPLNDVLERLVPNEEL